MTRKKLGPQARFAMALTRSREEPVFCEPKPARNLGMVGGDWYALLREPGGLPVLFASRKQAEENRMPDEYIVNVRLRPVSIMLLLRGARHALMMATNKRFALPKGRPRLPVEAKQKRGSMAAVKLEGAGRLTAALVKARARMHRTLKRELAEQALRALKGKKK